MQRNADKIFSGQHGEVPEEMLVRYARGLATPEEQRQIEEAMADDPFLSDAVEGMMKVENPDKINADLQAIQERINRKINVKIRPIHSWLRWAQAAAAILILSAGIWMVNDRFNNSTEKLFTDELEPYPAPAPESASIIDEATAIGETKQTKPVESPAISNNETNIKPLPPAEKDELPVVHDFTTVEEEAASTLAESDEVQVAPSADMSVNEQLQEQDKQSFNETVIQPDVKSNKSNEPKAQQPSAAATKSTEGVSLSEMEMTEKKADMLKYPESGPILAEAMKLYEAGNYPAANDDFDKVLATDPANEQALFYAGVSYLAAGNAEEALSKLKKLENKKSSTYYEASLWYQALAYVQKGDKKEAAKMLEKVIKLQGSYREKAEELLQQL
ncbi:MAG: tetratricopeptide repeat protein [Chitinophagaceae bacterium]|nr:tetratricopeptide repeat protein [Chitinophagaceae bacterium]